MKRLRGFTLNKKSSQSILYQLAVNDTNFFFCFVLHCRDFTIQSSTYTVPLTTANYF